VWAFASWPSKNLAKAAYAADHFGREAKVLFAGAPRFHEFVVQTTEDSSVINSRCWDTKSSAVFLEACLSRTRQLIAVCCTELDHAERIDTVCGLLSEYEETARPANPHARWRSEHHQGTRHVNQTKA